MAKAAVRWRTRTVTPTVRVVAPPNLARRAGRAAGQLARRAGGAARAAAQAESHRLWAIGAAGSLALAKRGGITIPDPLGIGPAATGALVAYAIGRWGNSRVASHMATGLACVAAYSYLSGAGVAGEGVAGFDDDNGED